MKQSTCVRVSVTVPAAVAERIRTVLRRACVSAAEVCRRALVREADRIEREERERRRG